MQASENEPLPVELRLLHWPLAQSGWKGIFFLVVLLAIVLLVHNYAQQPAMAPIALLAVLAATFWFWMPVRYVFRPSGIDRRFLTRKQHIAWANILGYELLSEGVRIRCNWHPSSIYVCWDGHKDVLLRILDTHIRRKQLAGSSVSRGSSQKSRGSV